MVDRDTLAAGVAGFERRASSLGDRKAAAVAVVADAAGVLVTKRAPRMRAHAGQWALPGGRVDDGETAEQAALRELEEELGLTVGADAVLGRLDDYPTRSGYRITPVVMWADDAFSQVHANPAEVASVHVATWSMLAVEPVFVSIPESTSPVIQLPMLGTRIHAPTAAVLYQVRELALHGRSTRVDHLEQPVFAWR
jgi:mutator protein MutT